MKVATWNLNSIRARIDALYTWLEAEQPDVVCIQESKCVDHLFPWRELELIGYQSVFHGQKSYNGVAILSPHPITDVHKGFFTTPSSSTPVVQPPPVEGELFAAPAPREQARLIAGTVKGVRIISAYVPNGHAVGSDKFRYKLDWLERLRRDYLDVHHKPTQDILLCGDFNVAPRPEDVWDEGVWRDSIINHPDVLDAYERVLDFGFTDTFTHLDPMAHSQFSWWDYSREGFAKNRGVRIDLILATASILTQCTQVHIDVEERGKPKPSDHAPVIANFTRNDS